MGVTTRTAAAAAAASAAFSRRLRENAKKRCLNENFLLLDTLYAMSAFFAPDHIKVYIFIKFLIPPRKCSKALVTILADRQNSVLSMSFTPYQNKISDQSCVLS
jgi:hypothetical protein